MIPKRMAQYVSEDEESIRESKAEYLNTLKGMWGNGEV
jgi:hypothetical protein